MGKLKILLIGFAIIFLAGCLPVSLSPLYTKNDSVWDEKIVGTWIAQPEKDEHLELIFEKSLIEGYQMTLKDKEKVAVFTAHLVKLGDFLFLDLFPLNWKENVDANIEGNLIPAHSFFKISLEKNSLSLVSFDEEELLKKLQVESPPVSYYFAGDVKNSPMSSQQLILTDSTEKIQKFILNCAKDNSLFVDSALEFRKEEITTK